MLRDDGTTADGEVARINALVDPPAYCPGCLAEAGLPWPDEATTRHCTHCLDRVRRVWQVNRWNRDRDHQVMAGRASWTAFSARWRASSGLAPLSADAARRYVTPDMIRGPAGVPLPPELQRVVYRSWCMGRLEHVAAWLSDDPPPDPQGLWAGTGAGAGSTTLTTGTAVGLQAEEG